jgi:hypothetical protein
MPDHYRTQAQDVVYVLCRVKRDSFPLVTLFQNGRRAQYLAASAPSQKILMRLVMHCSAISRKAFGGMASTSTLPPMKFLERESVYIVGSRSGGWIMNGSDMSHLNYQKSADKVLSTKLFDTEASPSHKGFASDGSYIGDQEDWNGIEEVYKDRIARTGRSDVLGRVSDEVRARLDKIDADFTAKYGKRRIGEAAGEPADAAPAATENEGLKTHPKEVEPSPLLRSSGDATQSESPTSEKYPPLHPQSFSSHAWHGDQPRRPYASHQINSSPHVFLALLRSRSVQLLMRSAMPPFFYSLYNLSVFSIFCINFC